MKQSEAQMIQAAREGEAQGYRYLMNRYGRQVQLLVAQMVADVRDAEELTQDVFVSAFRHLDDFDPARAQFATWIGRIAHNAALNHLRRQGYEPLPLHDEHCQPDDTSLTSPFDSSADPAADRLAQLDDAIGRLRPEERELLHLRYYEEQSLGQMAELTGLAAGPLANRLQRIRDKLAKLMRQ